MMPPHRYDTLVLSDEPKIFGIPLVSGLPCIGLTCLGLLIGYGYQLFIAGTLVSLVLHVKFNGQGIRFFLSMMYWLLPHAVTSSVLGLRRSPASNKRVFLK